MARPALPLVAASVVALSSSPFCQAQEDVARRHTETGLALAAAGDTAGARAELQSAVDAARTLAETHHQLGRLLARKASTIETDFQERAAAASALRKALFLEPDNAASLAEYGFLLSREVDLKGRDRVVEHYFIDLAATPAGEYSLGLRVWERLAQRGATTSRTFTVAATQ